MIHRIIIAFGLLMGSFLAAWGASNTLSGLSLGNPITPTDLFYDVQTVGVGGVKVTGTQFLNFVYGRLNAGTNITTSGTPSNVTISVVATPTFTSLTTTQAAVPGFLTASGIHMQTATIASINGTTQCVQASSTGVLSGTSTTCGGGPGGTNAQVQINGNGALDGDPSFTFTTPTGAMFITTTGSITFGNVAATNLGMSITHVPGPTNTQLSFLGAPGGGGGSFFSFAAQSSSAFVSILMQRNSGSTDGQFGVAGGGGQFFIDAIGGANVFSGGTALMFGIGPQNASFESTLVIPSQTTVRVHNGTTPTRAEVYNTTDNSTGTPTNYERGIFDWISTANQLTIGSQAGGTGVGRVVTLIASNTRAQTISQTATTFAAALNAPAIAQLAANTTGYACWTTGTGAISEDSTTCLASLRRLKKDIVPFTDATQELMALKPSQFQWKNPADANQRGQQLGFIAEDVHDVDARLASYTGDGSLHGWRQDAMIAALVRGFQEQQAVIREQQTQIDDLKRRLH